MGGAVSGQEIHSLAQTLNFPSSEIGEGANLTGTDTTSQQLEERNHLPDLKQTKNVSVHLAIKQW